MKLQHVLTPVVCLAAAFAAVEPAAENGGPWQTVYRAGAAAGAGLVNRSEVEPAMVNGHACETIAVSRDPYAPIDWQFRFSGEALPPGPFTLEVEFVDHGAGYTRAEVLRDPAFNGAWAGSSRESGYTRLNTGTVRKAYFAFDAPPAQSAEAGSPNLRIGGLQYLRALRIGPPLSENDWAGAAASVPRDVTPMATLSRPMELVTTAGVATQGGLETLEASLEALNDVAPLARVLGFTSIESYVTWHRLEPEAEGAFDFSYYDAIFEKAASYGLKNFPLLIVGSAYALPDWFANSPENIGFTCLEHGLSNPIQSIWSPHHRRHVTRVLEAFGDHYAGTGLLEGVRLGPSGNYGESQYPAGGAWGYQGEDMHIHIGWWAGDAYALADFQQFLQDKYGTVAAWNAAWGTAHTVFGSAPLTLPNLILTPRERADVTDWYTGAMSDWCAWWAGEAARALPGIIVYQSAGGWGFREAGTDYPAQTKAMAPLGGGIRLTNETDSYEQNVYVTRLAVTAARHYGVELGYEPASSHTARGVAGRLFNTATTNGRHFFTYHSNVMRDPFSIQQWLEWMPVLDWRQPPLVDVAVFYPETANQLDDGTFRHLYAWGFYPRAREVRRHIEVDYLDKTLVRDGLLDAYKALVFCWGDRVESDVLARVDAWLRAGGTLIYPSFPRGPLMTVEGDSSIFARWSRGDTGQGRFVRYRGDMEPPSRYGAFVAETLRSVEGLHPWTAMALETERPEHVFLSVQADGHLMMLNYGDAEARVRLEGRFDTTVAPYGIVRVPLR